jgi:hypothetical protein
MVTAWGEWGNKLSITSQLLGINASKLSQLQSVGTLGGASGDAMEGTLRRMQDIQRQIRLGLNPDAMRVYQKAGLDPRKSAEENMPKAFEAVKNFKGSAEAKRVLMGILGIDESLIDIVNQGAKGYQKLMEEAQKYRPTSEANAKAARDFQRDQSALGLSIQGFGDTVMGIVGPILGPMLRGMADWIALNRDWIATRIGEEVKNFRDWLSGIDWAGTIKSVTNFFTAVNDTVQAIGGWKTAFEILIGLKFAGWALGIATSISGITNALGLLGTGTGAGAGFARLLSLVGKAGLVGAVTGAAVAANEELTPDYKGKSFVSGALGGAGVGAMIGSVIPGVGTAIGAGVGALVGGVGNAVVSNWSSITGHNASDPRAVRNNNPLNLSYMPGQGAIGSDGRFGVYKTLQDGVAANSRQLMRYQDTYGLNTVNGIIHKWAPSSENDSDGYSRFVAGRLGVGINDSINLHDQGTMTKLVDAMAKRESGRELDPQETAQGVLQALNNQQAVASSQMAQNNLRIDLYHNLPNGSQVTATGTGPLMGNPVNVQGTMPSFAAP